MRAVEPTARVGGPERGGSNAAVPLAPRPARHNRMLLGVAFAPCASAGEAASGRVQAVSTRPLLLP